MDSVPENTLSLQEEHTLLVKRMEQLEQRIEKLESKLKFRQHQTFPRTRPDPMNTAELIEYGQFIMNYLGSLPDETAVTARKISQQSRMTRKMGMHNIYAYLDYWIKLTAIKKTGEGATALYSINRR